MLWAYRTTPISSTRKTPFRLAYGTDALIHVEVGLDSCRTEVFNLENNDFGLRANVDFPKEEREAAYEKNHKYQLKVTQYYNLGIKKRSFQVSDLVLRELATSMLTKQGKLQPNWEGPYKIRSA